jgi:CheY-like chemotaxis protein
LDINLPDINGVEVCRRVRALQGIRQPAIIYYSGFSGTEVPYKEGADAYLTFPIESLHLSSVIEGAAKKRQDENLAPNTAMWL